jgi:hypothetical protein
MRKLLSVILVVGSSIALFHCASGGSSATHDKKDSGVEDPTPSPSSGPRKDSPPAFDAAPAPQDAGRDAADARAPVADSGPPKPPPPKPSAACAALTTCCSALTDSTSAGACWVAVDYTAGHSLINSIECGATYALLDCSGAIARVDLGPSCGQLAACCNSQTYGPYIGNDTACQDDWRTGNEDLCDSDLYSYYSDPYGDCL